MNYRSESSTLGNSRFDNVFVNPAAYRAFLRNGHWPDKTAFVLEIRPAKEKASITRHGKFQSGDPIALEAHVKDIA